MMPGFGWLVSVGVMPSDSEDERLRKATLNLASALVSVLAVVWVVLYASLGLWRSALIPMAYQVVALTSLALLAHRRYSLFRTTQLTLMLVLPFLLQASLGGFRNASMVSLWAVSAPLGALMFSGLRRSLPWFVAFILLTAALGILDPALAARAPALPPLIVVTFFVLNMLGVSTVNFLLLLFFVGERERIKAELDEKHRELQAEREKSERLLLNVLPQPIAERLKASPEVIADGFDEVSVLFADIVGFSSLSSKLSPREVVVLLDSVFAAFDRLAEGHGLEKIKTIGDAYMVAAGLPVPRADHAPAVADMALEMLAEVDRLGGQTEPGIKVRIGIASGPVVAGVIGRRKFSYDVWGATVNIASRMESHGMPGAIQVSPRTHELLSRDYMLEAREPIEIKGLGPMQTFLLRGRKSLALSETPH